MARKKLGKQAHLLRNRKPLRVSEEWRAAQAAAPRAGVEADGHVLVQTFRRDVAAGGSWRAGVDGDAGTGAAADCARGAGASQLRPGGLFKIGQRVDGR